MLGNVIAFVMLVLAPARLESQAPQPVVLASRTFSMERRYDVASVNQVFKDNILLGIRYMAGDVKSKADVNWKNIEKPFTYGFTLNPGEEFAFHDKTIPAYSKNIVKTTNAHFNSYEGFKSDGWLVGDGVCHLASFINWVAKDAGLDVYYSASHSFAKINEVPKEYGVSINSNTAYQNLYITNSKNVPVTIVFDYDGTNLTVKVAEGDSASLS